MKLSVIVCTYNYAHWLPDALRSLAAQTFPYFELLIVDDGSTDNTEQVVQQFRNQFRQCLYRKKSHTGLAESRNFGIQAATGTHIAFLDADDLWSPDYLEAMKGAFESNPEAELVCCDGLRVFASGEVFGSLFPPGLAPVLGRLGTAQELFSFFPYVAPSALVFSKSLYARVGPFNPRWPVGAEDWHWVIRAASQDAFFVRLDRKLVLYRHHGENLTNHVDEMFDGWVSTYQDIWGGVSVSSEVKAEAQRLTRRWLPGLLAHYPAARNRALLRRALKGQEKDWLLGITWFLTYFGLCNFAKSARQVKRVLRTFSPPKQKINLQALPEVIFGAISSQPTAAQAMVARKGG